MSRLLQATNIGARGRDARFHAAFTTFYTDAYAPQGASFIEQERLQEIFLVVFFYYFCVMFSPNAPDSRRGSQWVYIYFCMNVQSVEPGNPAKVLFCPSGQRDPPDPILERITS